MHGLGPARVRVLTLLEDAGTGLTAGDVGERLSVHANSARFHLEALATAGRVVRVSEPRTTRGRPRMLYAAADSSPPIAGRRYRLLAEMLATFVQEQLADSANAIEQRGRAWGRALPMAVQPAGMDPAQRAAASLVETLTDVGFDSRIVAEGRELHVEVSHCPFLEVAEGHRDVVCALHLGLMRGVLEEMDTSLEVRELRPLVEPSRCLAHLSS